MLDVQPWVVGTAEQGETRTSPRGRPHVLCGLPHAPGSKGEVRAPWRRGFWFSGPSSSTMSSCHQAGISPGTEREAPAVPGEVTSGADVLPGSDRDTVRQQDFQMPPGSKIRSPISLTHHTTRTEPQGQDRAAPQVRTPSLGCPWSSQGITWRKMLKDPAPAPLAVNLCLILSLNLSDFIFKLSVLIIPLSAKLKSPLIPGSFLPGKVLARCNQVTSQATFP